jgi:hypothetical protein
MSLTDTKIKNAKARDKVYRIADKKGLCVEVRPSGSDREALSGESEKICPSDWRKSGNQVPSKAPVSFAPRCLRVRQWR